MAYYDDDALRDRLGLETYVALFDDAGAFDRSTGIATAQMEAAVDRNLRGATARTNSWMPPNYKGTLPFPDPIPELAEELALLYGEALAWKRNPDYLAAMKMGPSVDALMKQADEMGKRIQAAVLQMYDAEVPTPANVGGIITTGGPTFMITDSDGNENGFGF